MDGGANEAIFFTSVPSAPPAKFRRRRRGFEAKDEARRAAADCEAPPSRCAGGGGGLGAVPELQKVGRMGTSQARSSLETAVDKDRRDLLMTVRAVDVESSGLVIRAESTVPIDD